MKGFEIKILDKETQILFLNLPQHDVLVTTTEDFLSEMTFDIVLKVSFTQNKQQVISKTRNIATKFLIIVYMDVKMLKKKIFIKMLLIRISHAIE